MSSPPGTTYSPIRVPTPPRRPPRPVSIMPIVAEYPPSIRNVSFENDQATRPASVWSSDDDDVMRRRCAAFFRPNEGTASSPPGREDSNKTGSKKRNRWLFMGILAVILIIIAGIVGGVLGSRAESSSHDDDTRGAEASVTGSGTLTGSTEGTGAASSDNPGVTGTKATIHDKSRVGSAVALPFEDPYRIAAFLNTEGHLAISVWTGSTMETFPVTSDKNSQLPKPATLSPLNLIVLSQSDTVHILYVGENHYLCLATMPARGDRGKMAWKGGRLETGDDGTKDSAPEMHQTSGDLRVTFEMHNNVDDILSGRPVDRVNILYEEGSKKHRGKDKYTLLSSVAPADPSQWTVSRYQFSESDDDSMEPQEDSQGLAMVPLFEEPGRQSGIRLIWDLSNKDHDSSFGVMKCKMKSVKELSNCWLFIGHWKSEEDHDKFLAMPKPLSLAIQRLTLDDKESPRDFMLLVLDGDDVFSELYWDGKQWNGMRRFLAVEDKSSNATRSFSSISVTPDGNLFGISDGRLRWYERLGKWWEGGFGEHDATWKLVEVVDTTPVEDD